MNFEVNFFTYDKVNKKNLVFSQSLITTKSQILKTLIFNFLKISPEFFLFYIDNYAAIGLYAMKFFCACSSAG